MTVTPSQGLTRTLTLDATDQSQPVYYRLGGRTTGGLEHWDEPRIYNDGSQ